MGDGERTRQIGGGAEACEDCARGDHESCRRNGGWLTDANEDGRCACHVYGQHGKPDARPANPAYEFIGPYGVNGFAPHRHDGRRHAHDGGADPHAHPKFEGDDRDRGGEG